MSYLSPYNEYHGLVLQKTIIDGIHDGEFNGTLLSHGPLLGIDGIFDGTVLAPVVDTNYGNLLDSNNDTYL